MRRNRHWSHKDSCFFVCFFSPETVLTWSLIDVSPNPMLRPFTLSGESSGLQTVFVFLFFFTLWLRSQREKHFLRSDNKFLQGSQSCSIQVLGIVPALGLFTNPSPPPQFETYRFNLFPIYLQRWDRTPAPYSNLVMWRAGRGGTVGQHSHGGGGDESQGN